MQRAMQLFLMALFASVAHSKAILESSSGSYFGVSIDFQKSSVQSYLAQTGVSPVVWNVFVQLPLNSTLTSYMDTILPQIAAVKGIALLTVEPMAGLAAVTTDSVQLLAKYITQYQKAGASFMVRYAHEMNGNWYPWGQQAASFIASHRLVTDVLRNSTCGVAMVWAPNTADGYPWGSAAVSPPVLATSSDSFKLMDTNKDGKVDGSDDAYDPYYPGDAYVDWVGMSSFHFGGQSFPYTSNQQANPYKFINAFTGTGNTDFYGRFCKDAVHGKPLMITETSAMYNPSNPRGQTEFQIKSDWWQQVFNVQGDTSSAKDMAVNFPKVKAILWFDEVKAEPTAGGAVIDWRYSANQQILSGLSSFIQLPAKSTGRKYWLQLPDFTSSGDAQLCAGTQNSTVRTPAIQNTSTYASTTPVTPTPSTTPAASVTTTVGGTTSGTASNVASLAGVIGRHRLA